MEGSDDLRQSLRAAFSPAERRQLASMFTDSPPATDRAIENLLLRQLDGPELRALYERLPRWEKIAVAEAVQRPDGWLPRGGFPRRWGVEAPADAYDPQGNRTGVILQSLLLLEARGRQLPAVLRERLATFVRLPEPPPFATAASAPEGCIRLVREWGRQRLGYLPMTVHLRHEVALVELMRLLRLIEDRKVLVSDATLRPRGAAVEAIAEVLVGDDFVPIYPWRGRALALSGPVRAIAWTRLLMCADLAHRVGPRLELTSLGRKALEEGKPSVLTRLWKRWVACRDLAELDRLELIKTGTWRGVAKVYPAATLRRQALDLLARCPAGAWFHVDAFLALTDATRPAFSLVKGHLSPFYIGDMEIGSFLNAPEIVDHRYLLCLLLEYVATLGAIDVAITLPFDARFEPSAPIVAENLPALSRYDGLQYLRITPLGAAWLGLETSRSATAGTPA